MKNSLPFSGWPTTFTEHQLTKKEGTKHLSCITTTFCKTDENDWVYCVHPLSERRIIVVTGTKLDIFEKNKDKWHKSAAIIKDTPVKDRLNRPFISSIIPLSISKAHFGAAIFGGGVSIVDVEKQAVTREYHEHKKRVWTLIELIPNMIVSCSDDATIKLWDVRMAKSCVTLDGNIGRVSTLLKTTEQSFISGSAPDDLYATSERAQFTLWDLRKKEK